MSARPWARTVASAGVVGTLICGCQDAGDGFVWANYGGCPPNATLSESQRAALPPFGTSPWDKWATLASHVPGGFAGEYLMPVGLETTHVAVALVDTTQASVALDSLAANWSIVSTKPFSFARDSVTIHQARWTFIELNDWYRLLGPIAQYQFGAMGASLNMADNRIEIAFESVDRRSAMLRELSAQRVPCWLVAADVEHVRLD